MLNLTTDKTTYAPGSEIYVTVEKDAVSPTVPVDYTITATRNVAGVDETAAITVTVQYPQEVTQVAVTATGGLELAPQVFDSNVWGGRIPSEPPAAA